MQRVKEFFKPVDPKELVRKWQSTLRTEQRALDKQIREISWEEKKVHKSIKEAAKRGDMTLARNMAKEIVQSRKAISRLTTNKAQLMSVNNALIEQLAMLKVSKTLAKSTEVMRMVNGLMRLPEMQKTMVEMSKEMMKAGLIEEMMDETLNDALDGEGVEEETDAEIERVLDELVGETLAALPAAQRRVPAQRVAAAQEEEEEDDAELQARLQAIRT